MTRRTFLSMAGGIIGFIIIYAGAGFVLQRELFQPLLQAITRSESRDLGEIRETIELYNKVLTDLYVSDGQVMRLDDLPVRTVLKHEIYRELDFLRARKLVLIYDMASVRFLSAKVISPFAAEATTYEEWNYVYRSGAQRRQASAIKGFSSGYRYHLIRPQGRWRIADVERVQVAAPGEKDEFKF